MTWQSSILSLLLLINAGVAMVILQAIWKRRHTKGATPLFWMVIAIAVWSGTSAMELAADDITQKILWSKLRYLGIINLPPLWFWFALEYNQLGDPKPHIRHSYLILLWIIPVITLVLALSNDWHGVNWSDSTTIQGISDSLVHYGHGPWSWVFTVYSYATFLAGTLILIFSAARFPSINRHQTIILIIGAVIPWIANLAYLVGLTQRSGVYLMPIAFCVASVIYANQLFRFHMFDSRDTAEQKPKDEYLRLLIDALPEGILVVDQRGQIAIANHRAEQLLGYEPGELNSKALSSMLPHWSTGSSETVSASLQDPPLLEQVQDQDILARRKDGSRLPIQINLSQLSTPDGPLVLVVLHDMTLRIELEQMRDEFMQTIVHDLRNPLTSILFALDMINDLPETLRLPPEMSMMLAISRDNSWRMLGMVNAMLDYSKLDSGKMPIQCEPIILAELVEQCFRFQSQLAARRELLLLNDVPYDLPLLSADRTLLSRVLQNLIDNAIKYAPQGSNIIIRAEVNRPRDAFLVSIHDDGPGVPAELRNQLFQKFAASTSARGGTGLGLAFCRLAIEAHKGEIWVECEEGQGTTFLFTLPIQENSDTERS